MTGNEIDYGQDSSPNFPEIHAALKRRMTE